MCWRRVLTFLARFPSRTNPDEPDTWPKLSKSNIIRQLKELSEEALLPPPLFVDLRRKHLSNPQALIASKGLAISRSSLAESLRWAENAQRVYSSQDDVSIPLDDGGRSASRKRAEAVNGAFEVYACAVLNDEDIVNVCTCFSRRSVHDVNRSALFLDPPGTSLSGPAHERDIRSRILLLLVVMGVQFMSFQVCRGALPLWTRCHERCRDAATLPELIKRRRWKFLLFRAACFIEIARKKHYTEDDEKRIVVFLIEEELGVRPQEPIFDDVGYRDRALKLALRDLSEATRDGLTVPKPSGGVGSLQSLCVDQLCTQTKDVLGLIKEADPKVAGPVLLHRPELELETLQERRAVYFFRGLTWRALGQTREAKADLELFVELEQSAQQKDDAPSGRFLLTALCHLARLNLLQTPPDVAAARKAMETFVARKDLTQAFWNMDGSGCDTWEPSGNLGKVLHAWYKRMRTVDLSSNAQRAQNSPLGRVAKWMSCGPVV